MRALALLGRLNHVGVAVRGPFVWHIMAELEILPAGPLVRVLSGGDQHPKVKRC